MIKSKYTINPFECSYYINIRTKSETLSTITVRKAPTKYCHEERDNLHRLFLEK
ncbi:hypothetical protein P689_1199 [Candidatus Riesia pediculischaeffi PTSU]|uniref:Uncharacterized protein n=1 Tax=Candidatus Riesia pediculischaeffi PTSU TaxID=1401651 RepID=A0A0C1S158_9ENTR|nr:hypothetical protein P689_1199 [Candidatus Riesia pediculischaeffi PTSU]